MQTANLIAKLAQRTWCDTDLGLIYAIWPLEDRHDEVMRSSDHHAIRKAASALDLIGDVLVRRLAPKGAVAYRALPEIHSTTRLRTRPDRFWLEIALGEPSGNWAAQPVLFVELSKTGARTGIRFPTEVAAFGKRAVKNLHQYLSSDSPNLKGWQLEQRGAPAERAACSNDLNAWLATRAKARQQKAVLLTLSKASADRRPLMEVVVAGLSGAAVLMDEMGLPKRAAMRRVAAMPESFCPAMA
ncbi:hypothetical protein [Phaeovulum sp.]|uniref:hypothetical protein n=1 Tax=Phaeovulum sp. TaxID=2934796 RepID=UPI00356A830F